MCLILLYLGFRPLQSASSNPNITDHYYQELSKVPEASRSSRLNSTTTKYHYSEELRQLPWFVILKFNCTQSVNVKSSERGARKSRWTSLYWASHPRVHKASYTEWESNALGPISLKIVTFDSRIGCEWHIVNFWHDESLRTEQSVRYLVKFTVLTFCVCGALDNTSDFRFQTFVVIYAQIGRFISAVAQRHHALNFIFRPQTPTLVEGNCRGIVRVKASILREKIIAHTTRPNHNEWFHPCSGIRNERGLVVTWFEMFKTSWDSHIAVSIAISSSGTRLEILRQ